MAHGDGVKGSFSVVGDANALCGKFKVFFFDVGPNVRFSGFIGKAYRLLDKLRAVINAGQKDLDITVDKPWGFVYQAGFHTTFPSETSSISIIHCA